MRVTIGFTGAREGLTPAQRAALNSVMAGWEGATLHHGDCVGADEEAHICAVRLGGWRIEVHPGDGPHRLRAGCGGHVHHPEKPYLDRNSDIVEAATVLLACPAGPEVQRSGTWSTIRKARRKGIKRVIVWPNGDVTYEYPAPAAPQYRCTRPGCGRDEIDARANGCTRGPCPMEFVG